MKHRYPDVDRQRAVTVAKLYIEESGWPWMAPIRVKRVWGKWEVITNANGHGGYCFVTIDAKTGQVTRSAFDHR